ncbi:MAG TPA: electron transfer flavoprotein subunit alpha/FixB family protein [Planctomycetes bacterium]|nr:electron transfer flavoprotein subunit alpha/FixB family protein [Planctomycetota bacterium]
MSVLAFCEVRDGRCKKAAFEAITAAKKLAADLGGSVTAVVVGHNIQDDAKKLAAWGAERILAADHEFLALYSTGGYGRCLVQAVELAQPKAVIVPATIMGKDLAAWTAAKLGVPLASDCTEFKVEDGALRVRRPVFAGKALAWTHGEGEPFVLGLRPNTMAAEEINPGGEGSVEPLPLTFDPSTIRAVVKEITGGDKGDLDVAEAEIVVAGGRGVGGPEGFEPLRELAKVLGAAVGASRAAVDAGWIDHAAQVGQTGKVVSPNLYIAIGISGAIQHLAGMRTAKVIVAINKDPEAPIFKVADYGIVGDLVEVVPALTEAFQKALA